MKVWVHIIVIATFWVLFLVVKTAVHSKPKHHPEAGNLFSRGLQWHLAFSTVSRIWTTSNTLTLQNAWTDKTTQHGLSPDGDNFPVIHTEWLTMCDWGIAVLPEQWLPRCCSWVTEHWLHKPGSLALIPGNCCPFHFPLICFKVFQVSS